MRALARVWWRIRAICRRDALEEGLDEEIRFHIERQAEKNLRAGMPLDEARRQARLRFGGLEGIRERTRDEFRPALLENTLRDVRYAGRTLRRAPGFAATAILTLALGVGANSAIFTLVYSVLLRPLPFPEAARLFVVGYQPAGAPFWLFPGLSDRHYLALRESDPLFEATTSFASAPVTLAGAGDPVRLVSAVVTPEFFRVLGVSPAVGRTFGPRDADPGGDALVILGDGLWRGRFGSDPAVIGRRITLDGVAHTVIGVLPEGFSFPADAALWIPLAVRAEPGLSYTRPVIGRLRSGVAAEQARAAWEALATTLPVEGPPTGWLPQLIPLKDAIVGDVRTPLLIFSGAVGLVLLIVCANLSNLLLMRGLSRRQEILTRLSLGAGRPRVVRQLLGEAAVMGVVGGAAAVLMTSLTVPALLAVVPAGRLPRAGEIQVDGSVLAFTFALAMMVALVVGLLPAVQATRGDVSVSSRELAQWTTAGSSRLRHALVVAEVAVALVLLVGAGLLARSFIRLRAVEPGFRPERVMTMTVDLPSSTYAQLPGLQAFHGQLLRSLSALPDVTSAGAVNWMPFGDVVISGDLLLPDGRGDQAIKAAVTPGYFRAMGVRLKRGRDFADADRAGAPGVVIVSERVARRLWGREDAIGRRLSIESRPAERDWLTVVGVVDDVRQGSLKEEPGPAIYQPYQQVTRPFFLTRMTFVVRTSGHPQRIAPAMRAALRDLDPHLAAHSIASMDDVVGRTIAEPRFQTHLLAVFSGLAVVLAAIGVYGVLAFSVTERRREIGIRVALGADATVLVRMVLHRVLVLATYGIAAGIAGAFAFSHVLRGLLFEIGPTDAPTFLGAAVGLTAVALIAGWIPARRAAAVDPVTILRAE